MLEMVWFFWSEQTFVNRIKYSMATNYGNYCTPYLLYQNVHVVPREKKDYQGKSESS